MGGREDFVTSSEIWKKAYNKLQEYLQNFYIFSMELKPRKGIMSQTSFSLYLHNQWINFHKLSCAGNLQMRAICIYVVCIKATTND